MNFNNYTFGSWQEQFQYKSFLNSHVNHQWSWDDPQINTLLSEANRRLGELNGLSFIVPDLDRFIQI